MSTPTATGFVMRHLPDSVERDRVLGLLRLGQRFAGQHVGRRPGVLRRHVERLVAETRPESFDRLLVELEVDALRRQFRNEGPILAVDRIEQVVRYAENGEVREAGFRRLRNIAGLRKHRSR